MVLVLTFWWGVGAGLQRDAWFQRWVDFLQKQPPISRAPVLSLVVALCVPVLVLILVSSLILYFLSGSWLFFVYVPVLFYSLGRGNLASEVRHYLAISQRGDSVAASHWVDAQRGNAMADNAEPDNVDVDDWQKLHSQALDIISYRSFERLFAVLFWFFILGAVGALLYRLSVLYCERTDTDTKAAERWLQLLEWPAVRALGLSWALVGNFDSCFAMLKRDFLNVSTSSMGLLSRCLRGALGMTPAIVGDTRVPEPRTSEVNFPPLSAPTISGVSTEPDSLGLITASLALIPRALLLWVCVVALVSLLI